MAKKNLAEEKLLEKIAELEESWKRALADYHNLEKRIKEDKEEFIKFANTVLLLKFLPILDNLEKAQEHLKDAGLEIVIKQFGDILKSEGVEEIGSAGEKFDPAKHEALEVVPGDKEEEVEAILGKGYVKNGQVLRPAQVRVIKKS